MSGHSLFPKLRPVKIYMKIPKRLKIGAHTVKIIQGARLDGDGEFDTHADTIFSDSRLSQTQKEETLIHEMLGHQNPSLHADNHALLQAIAHGVYQILRDNNMLR